MLLNKLNKVLYQMININLIQKLKMIKDIQFVTICGIMEYMYQKIGKTTNIKIQNAFILNMKIGKNINIIIIILQML